MGAEERLRPTTVRGYRKHVEQYLVPLLGQVSLRGLTYTDIQLAFARIAQKHLAADRGPLSASTVRRIQAMLRAALAAAVNAGLIDHNPARDLDPPREQRPQPQVWTDSLVEQWGRTGERPSVAVWTPLQTATFLHLIRDHRLHALYRLYATRGLRRGEALALRWSNIDFERRVLTIERQLQKLPGGKITDCEPKSRAGKRQIALDHDTIRSLRAQQHRQQADKAAAGDTWVESGYVFASPQGGPLAPDHVGHVFQQLVRTHGLPPVRLHDLRHGAASLALTAHVDLKVIQHQVGHASIVTTADTYVSVMPQTTHEGAEATARLLREAAREYARSQRGKPPTGRNPSIRQSSVRSSRFMPATARPRRL
ncbi:integrase [Kitasatospora sp. MAP12-15]|uniref:tyrosine-type recombinase/integrase n=1 Tax=unclassified Kitasatospora TaxID=2633591 RepID=UPI00247DF702|nr:integrase [Kitasatospora sp. MAP12-44]